MTIESTSAENHRTPPIHSARQDFSDFAALAKTIHGWGLDWIQLDHGPLNAAIQQTATTTSLSTRFRFSRKFHQRGTTPSGVRTLGFIGERSPDVEWRGATGGNTHILAFPANNLFEVVSQPGFYGDTVSIPEDRIRSVAEFMGLPDPLEGMPNGLAFIETDPGRIIALRNAISTLHATATTQARGLPVARVLSDLELDVHSALVAALQSRQPADTTFPESRLRTRAVRAALEYIEHQTDEPPTVSEICRASGVSWRTLDYAFRERFGVTPKQYLQATRLMRVRQKILQSDRASSISEIAAHWGFWHMGQFAADYRNQFGELPSRTLRRNF